MTEDQKEAMKGVAVFVIMVLVAVGTLALAFGTLQMIADMAA